MTPRRRRRLLMVLAILLGVSASAALAFKAFRQNLLYYYTPTELVGADVPADRSVRVGGLVKTGSVVRETGTVNVSFVLTDPGGAEVLVQYSGLLPDLFREGQGIVATGSYDGVSLLAATEVLAKHDEKYMPPGIEGYEEAADTVVDGQ